MSFKCTRCKETVDIDYNYAGIRCSYCGHRILIKKRSTVLRKIKAE